ncbi:MAG: hypothetical protein AB7G12_14575 [Thermoanaerobaculia bacterium]
MSARRTVARAALFAIAVLAAATAFAAGSTPVTVTVEPPFLLVGDRVTATVRLPLAGLPADADPRFPDWSDGWGKAEVVAASEVAIEGEGNDRAAVQRLTLTAFEPGRIELPPKRLTWGDAAADSAETPADTALEVRTVLAADDQELRPAPPAPPRALPTPRAVVWALGTALVLTIAAGILAWRRKFAADPLAAPRLSPLAELERALGLLAERQPDEIFRGLSLALRRFLGRSFSFRAVESTTTEIQRRLLDKGVERSLVQRAVQILRLSDQVKFARRPATIDEARERTAETSTIANAVETWLRPAEVASTSPAPEALAR